MHERARQTLAGTIPHDIYAQVPHPPYIVRARAASKWDADGRELIDLWMGHGALLLGHAPPTVTAAIGRQLASGTHYGGCHELAVRWAEIVQRLVPSAERVRFVASGTEATLLAIRLARAHTGRSRVVRIDGHFHGWHDAMLPPGRLGARSGVSRATTREILVARSPEAADVQPLLNLGDVAAVILEPGGGSSGAVPVRPDALRQLRELTGKLGVLLIFDEVVSGFRYATGGVQSLTGVIPDLTTLAKVLAGGLPGGAVVGRHEIMAHFTEVVDGAVRPGEVLHSGTFNANPLAAAAGLATLEQIEDGRAQLAAERAAGTVVAGIEQGIRRRGVDASVYRSSSIIHLLLEPERFGIPNDASPKTPDLVVRNQSGYLTFRCALLAKGVDMHPCHGWLSSVHGDREVEVIVGAFDKALAQYFA